MQIEDLALDEIFRSLPSPLLVLSTTFVMIDQIWQQRTDIAVGQMHIEDRPSDLAMAG